MAKQSSIELEHGSYHPLDRGGRFAGGIVDCGTNRPSWLPYADVPHIDGVTERAHRFWGGRPPSAR
jgi:hypothetical protein